MKATPFELRDIGIAVLGNPETKSFVLSLPPQVEPAVDSPLWFRRRCLPVAQLVLMTAEARGLTGARLVFGQFQDEHDLEPYRHAWIELDDGTIVDPTSEQMGGPECAIVERGDREYAYYHSRGSWREGDPD